MGRLDCAMIGSALAPQRRTACYQHQRLLIGILNYLIVSDVQEPIAVNFIFTCEKEFGNLFEGTTGHDYSYPSPTHRRRKMPRTSSRSERRSLPKLSVGGSPILRHTNPEIRQGWRDLDADPRGPWRR